jgi:hypothetical protein
MAWWLKDGPAQYIDSTSCSTDTVSGTTRKPNFYCMIISITIEFWIQE